MNISKNNGAKIYGEVMIEKDTWAMRIDLAKRGWHTEFHISRTGIGSTTETHRSISVRAKTNYWHKQMADVHFHLHHIGDIMSDEFQDASISLFAKLYEGCLRAWEEMPDEYPVQKYPSTNPDSMEFVHSEYNANLWFKKGKIYNPSENIPESSLHYSSGNNEVLKCIIEAARKNYHVESIINSYFGRKRYVADCENRDWGHNLRLMPRGRIGKDGSEIAFNPIKYPMMILDETIIANDIMNRLESIEQSLENYAPGGQHHGKTINNLPPGYQTIKEWKFEEEKKKMISQLSYVFRQAEEGVPLDVEEIDYIIDLHTEMSEINVEHKHLLERIFGKSLTREAVVAFILENSPIEITEISLSSDSKHSPR